MFLNPLNRYKLIFIIFTLLPITVFARNDQPSLKFCPSPFPQGSRNVLESCDPSKSHCVTIGWPSLLQSPRGYYTKDNCEWKAAKMGFFGGFTYTGLKCSDDMSTCVVVGVHPVGMGDTDADYGYTNDNGQSWEFGRFRDTYIKCSYSNGEWYYAALNAVDTTDRRGERWVAVGGCGFPNIPGGLSVISNDRGRSWVYSATQPAVEVNKVSCNSSMYCIASGDSAAYVSYDGGNTWN